jgi:hypothetical protein
VPDGRLRRRNGFDVCFPVPPTLLSSAFGDTWQQRDFKLQLSVHKDGDCIAGAYQQQQQQQASKHVVQELAAPGVVVVQPISNQEFIPNGCVADRLADACRVSRTARLTTPKHTCFVQDLPE